VDTQPPNDHSPDARPVQALIEAWAGADAPPNLRDFLPEDHARDSGLIAELVRTDAQHRMQQGLVVRLELYADQIGPEAMVAGGPLRPGAPLTQLVLGLERMAGNSADDVFERLGDAYASDIEQIFDGVGTSGSVTLPPTATSDPSDHPAEAKRFGVWVKGDTIGAFTLRKKLGEGGFGEVWLASREKPHQQVAVKVLRADAADDASIKRFEAEAQALAFLEHRYIAKILDASTVRGMPYLVMEYVEGKPLTKYCDDRRLSIPQRLELMARICEGVQHAHLRGLIHRDLKPDNILVTEVTKHTQDLDEHEDKLIVRRTDGKVTVAVPKIVDFGLAKAAEKTIRLADGTLTVDLGKMMGTPEYMSPEQAGHQPLEVTQQADIFSLGVILYELLTGTLPLTKDELRERVIDELVAMLRGTPRPDPSTKLSSLDAETIRRVSYQRGDLSPREFEQRVRSRVRHLCGKALRLEAERRFTSSAAMAQDIRNYLADRDFVEAAAEPRTQKVLRNIKRHRGSYSAVAVVLIAVSLAGSWGYRESLARRDAMQQQRASAEVLRLFTQDLIAEASPEEAGRQMTVEELLDGAAERLNDPERIPLHPTSERSLRAAIGQTYVALGNYDKAEPHLDSALSLPAARNIRLDQEARLLLSAADAKYRAGKYDEVIAISERILGLAPVLPDDLSFRGQAVAFIASALKKTKQFDRALAEYNRARDFFRRLGPDGHIDVLRQSYNIAILLSEWSDEETGPERADLRRRAIESYRALAAAYQEIGESAVLSLANVHRELGRDLLKTGSRSNASEAEKLLRSSLKVSLQRRGEGARQTLMARVLLGRALMKLDRPQEALDEFLRALTHHEEQPGHSTSVSIIIMEDVLEAFETLSGPGSSEAKDWLKKRVERLDAGPAYDWVVKQIADGPE